MFLACSPLSGNIGAAFRGAKAFGSFRWDLLALPFSL